MQIDSPHACPIQLNNRAVWLAKSMFFDEARTFFSTALTIVHGYLVEIENSQRAVDEMGDCMELEEVKNKKEDIVRGADSDCSMGADGCFDFVDTNMESSEETSGSFVYSGLVVLTKQHRYSHRDYARMSFLVLLNLAITTHLQAIHEGMSGQHLLKALAHYKLAYNISMSGDFIVAGSHILAIVNNIGQIYKAMVHDDQAHHCFEHLLSTVMLMHVTGEVTTSRKQEVEYFMSNVLHMILKKPRTASAA